MNSKDNRPFVFYITSARNGFHAFTFKEIELLELRGVKLLLGLTKISKGNFNPHAHWKLTFPSARKFILGTTFSLFSRPVKLSIILGHSLRNRSLNFLLTALSFYFDIVRGKISVSVCHCQMGDHKLNIAYYLSVLLDKPFTTTIHAHELYRIAEERYENLNFLYERVSKIFTISLYNKRLIENKFNVSPERVEVMYLYPANFSSGMKEKTKILIVGNWFYKKGYDFLLRTLKNIDRDDFVLWVVGDYTNDKTSIDVRRKVFEYELEHKVTIFGPQPQSVVEVLMYACDIFCLPSVTDYYEDGRVREKEGIPVALMEAMSWGKPVISTHHAGIPELVEDFLVEENNCDDLEQKIIFLLDNRDSYVEIGERNRKNVHAKFSESNVDVLANAFKEYGYEES